MGLTGRYSLRIGQFYPSFASFKEKKSDLFYEMFFRSGQLTVTADGVISSGTLKVGIL